MIPTGFMPGRTSLLAAALLTAAFLGAACASTGASQGGPAPSAPPGGAVITAQAIAFDLETLVVPADRPFQLLFENREAAPHNVAIRGEQGDPLFVGEVFAGPASRIYQVPALAAGSYRFLCDVHPEMAGTVMAQ